MLHCACTEPPLYVWLLNVQAVEPWCSGLCSAEDEVEGGSSTVFAPQHLAALGHKQVVLLRAGKFVRCHIVTMTDVRRKKRRRRRRNCGHVEVWSDVLEVAGGSSRSQLRWSRIRTSRGAQAQAGNCSGCGHVYPVCI